MSEQFANLASSTLALPYTAGSGSITVLNAASFPTSGTFTLVIRDQNTKVIKLLFRVTSVAGAKFSGASEGTDAAAAVGDLVDGTMVTAAALTQIKADVLASVPSTSYIPGLLTEDKSGFGGVTGNAKTEYQNVLASATQTLLNYTGGQPGYIARIWMAINCSDTTGALLNSTIKITVDGEVTPAINCRLPLFFAAEYVNTTNIWASRYFGSDHSANIAGFYINLPIPFNSSVKVEVTNGSATTTAVWFAEVTYVTGVANAWPRTKKLWVSSGTLTNQLVNTVCTMVNVSGLSQGRLAAVYASIDSFPNGASPATAPLEGNVKIYFDGAGSPNFESSGTEDYFGSSDYWSGYSPPVVTDYKGITFGNNNTWNAYRVHIPDPMHFSNALKVTWNAGDSTQVNFTGGVRLAYTVFYYTEG